MKPILFQLLILSMLASSVAETGNSYANDSEINLGAIAIESTIRYPSTQVIETSESLQKMTRVVLGREFQRIELEILRACEELYESP